MSIIIRSKVYIKSYYTFKVYQCFGGGSMVTGQKSGLKMDDFLRPALPLHMNVVELALGEGVWIKIMTNENLDIAIDRVESIAKKLKKKPTDKASLGIYGVEK